MSKFQFSKRIAIDLGTANTLVWVAGEGLIINEPSVVASSVDDGRVVAVGMQARQMLGRTPESLTASRPLKDGVIADYEATRAMLSYFINRVASPFLFWKPEVMICVPAGCTQVERRAVLDAALSAGARVAYLIDEPLAAAIGARIPIAAASGNMIVDSGGGATEAAIISLGGVVVHKSVRVAGNRIDEAIQNYVRRRHNLIIGDQMAEEVKIKIGTALPAPPAQARQASGTNHKEESMEVSGRDQVSGLPRTITISSSEVAEAIRPVLNLIIGAIKAVLEDIPPELASDIIDKGITMSGGTSLLAGFDKLMTQEVGVPVHLAQDPLLCVARGTGLALENLDTYRRSLTKK
ncbi:rod shape-determining protein [Candidatus Microgenomates bacterium]|nr:rod shape-determining protein [Candidatus Microgenomates bacterium]